MSGAVFAMLGACDRPARHPGAMWLGTESDHGTVWEICCTPCGDRPWTVAAQAARRGLNEAPTDPALSLRPVLNTASQAARAWYARLGRRNAR